MTLRRCRVAAARLPPDAAFAARAAAHLHPCEAAQALRLRHPVRRRQWLAARILAKRLAGWSGSTGVVEPGAALAVVDLAADDAAAATSRWAVARAAEGAPMLMEGDTPSALSLSLSHVGDLVAAAVSPCRVGTDVERIGPGVHGLALKSFPPEEAAWTASEPDRGPLLATVLWSVKESFLKTGACGPVSVARVATLDIQPSLSPGEACRLLDGESGWVPFPADPPALGGAAFDAFIQRVDDMVLAVVAVDVDKDASSEEREQRP